MMTANNIAQLVADLLADMPLELAERVAEACLQDSGAVVTPALRRQIHHLVGQEVARRQVDALLDGVAVAGVAPSAIGYALLTGAQVVQRQREAERISLLWTGPTSRHIPVRRTEQALIEIIEAAEVELHLVSYVAYQADGVREALRGAIGRGVVVHLYLETMDKDGEAQLSGLRWLGRGLTSACRVYAWPQEQRRVTPNGKTGALHAKIALADERMLFISSANLTGYALGYNMEMGVLFVGGENPAVVRAHLHSLVKQGVFRRLDAQRMGFTLLWCS